MRTKAQQWASQRNHLKYRLKGLAGNLRTTAHYNVCIGKEKKELLQAAQIINNIIEFDWKIASKISKANYLRGE